MGAFKNEKNGTWYVQFRYTDWQGLRQQKLKRGFATKREAQEWERAFLTEKKADVTMPFKTFTELYEKDVRPKLKENTWLTKEHIIKTKILPYFEHISPLVGKQGQPMTVFKRSTGKKYDFGADATALYNYHLFIYEDNCEIIAIFHRQNSSGCKSVFLETANNILKTKGIKLEMNLIIPLSDKEKNITPVKITLQCLRNDSSTDAADNIKKKKTVIHDMGLNLEVIDNSPIAAIIKNMQLGKVSKEAAFAQIKELQGNSEDFNDAELKLKIGKRTRSVSWNDFENIVGIHDITEELHSAYAKSKNFVAELTMLSNKYYHDIIESGVINDK